MHKVTFLSEIAHIAGYSDAIKNELVHLGTKIARTRNELAHGPVYDSQMKEDVRNLIMKMTSHDAFQCITDLRESYCNDRNHHGHGEE
jgi:hypothetical protein